MASHARSLLQDIFTALRQSHTHHDLSTVSGTKRVVIDAGEPPVLSGPWVVLSAPKIPQENSSITPLAQYEVEGTLQWWAFCASDRDDPEERALDALDLAHDIMRALRVAHADPNTYGTLGACHNLQLSLDDVRGDASIEEIPFGLATGTITYQAFSDGGI